MRFTFLKGHANYGTGTKETISGRIHKPKALRGCSMAESANLTELIPNPSNHGTKVYNSHKNDHYQHKWGEVTMPRTAALRFCVGGNQLYCPIKTYHKETDIEIDARQAE